MSRKYSWMNQRNYRGDKRPLKYRSNLTCEDIDSSTLNKFIDELNLLLIKYNYDKSYKLIRIFKDENGIFDIEDNGFPYEGRLEYWSLIWKYQKLLQHEKDNKNE